MCVFVFCFVCDFHLVYFLFERFLKVLSNDSNKYLISFEEYQLFYSYEFIFLSVVITFIVLGAACCLHLNLLYYKFRFQLFSHIKLLARIVQRCVPGGAEAGGGAVALAQRRRGQRAEQRRAGRAPRRLLARRQLVVALLLHIKGFF